MTKQSCYNLYMSKNSHRKHEQKVDHSKKPSHIPEEDVFTEHKTGSEILIALIIFALGLFFMVPVYSATTVNMQFAILILFSLAVLVFIFTHWRKHKRHAEHDQLPLLENFVYLSIVSILLVAIIIQVVNRNLDLWLPAILIIAVLLKTLLISRMNKS